MPHSIHVGFLDPTELSIQMVQAITANNIINDRNIYIADPHGVYAEKYSGHSFNVYKQDTGAMMKIEVVVLTQKKSDLSALLACISTMTRGKILLVMSEGVHCDYVLDRVAKGTFVVCAPPSVNEAGEVETTMEFSRNFPGYMKNACADMVGSVCKILPA